ncbi:MAG: hypothetical protein K0R49_1273 [Burkholderiales bacterium]|jgi:hypothetical protein|nr:hypothetical protein [Burkholderiales bacterium]
MIKKSNRFIKEEIMLKQVKKFFKTYKDMAYAVDYLTNYMSYNLMNTRKTSYRGDPLTIFGREQLRFLLTSRVNLTSQQADRVINVALNNVISKTKASFMITRDSIYMALL